MQHRTTSLLISLGLLASPVAYSAPAATLLFSQAGTQIVGENGVPRPARQGDILQTGERLLTPPGGISQILLPDGSLIGLRPGSELKIDLPPPGADGSKQWVSLIQGTVRVIGSELMDARKPSAFTFQSGQATLKLQGADLESALVKGDGNRPQGGNDPGSYSRLLTGTGSIGSGNTVEPLALRQVSFVGTTNVPPVTLSLVSPTLFSPTTALLAPAGGANRTAAPDPNAGGTLPVTKLAPSLTTSTLTTPLITGISPPPAPAAPTTFSPITTTLLLQPSGPSSPTTTPSPGPTTPAPVFTAPVVIVSNPIITVPIQPPTLPPTRLPVVSCKVLRTC